MKVRNLSTLLAFTLMMGFAHAAPLTANEVFAAIDGETEYAEEQTLNESMSERVNFSIAPTSEADHVDTPDFWENPGSVGGYD